MAFTAIKRWAERAFHALLYAVLLTPLIFYRGFLYPFVSLRGVAFQVLVVALAALWVPLAIADRAYRPRLGWIGAAFAAFLAVLLAASVLGVDPLRSFWSTEDRGLGIVALLHFFAYFVMLAGAGPRFSWRRYLTVSIGVSVAAALPAYIWNLVAGFFLVGVNTRPSSFFGNPSYLASFLLFHLFFAAFFAYEEVRREKPRWGIAGAWAGVVLILAGAIFLTQTRGAVLGLGAGFLALCSVFAASRDAGAVYLYRGISLRRASAAVLFVALFAGAGFLATRASPVWQRVPGLARLATLSAESPDIQPRLIALGIVWDAFRARPLLGYGFENFKYPFDARYDPRLLRYSFGETFWDKPHNVLAEYAVTGGAVAVLAYLVFLAAVAWRIVRAPQLHRFAPFGIAALAAYVVQNLFLFDTYGSYPALIIFLAFVVASGPARVESPAPSVPRVARRIATAGAAACATALAGGMIFVNGSILYANANQYWGLNYLINQKVELGLQAFDRALAAPFDPYRTQVVRDRASALAQIWNQGIAVPDAGKHVATAMDDLAREIELQPNDFFVRVTWADVATTFWVFDPSYLDRADQYLDEAEKLSPRRQQIYYVRSKIAYLRGKPEEARKIMEEAIALDPEVGEPYFYAGLIAFQTGDIDGGFALLKRAQELGREPKNAQEMVLVAGYEGDRGNYEEAIRLYEAALRESPDLLEARLKLGLSYYYVGNRDSARWNIEQVTRAIDITKAPSFPQLKPILDDLRVEYTTPE